MIRELFIFGSLILSSSIFAKNLKPSGLELANLFLDPKVNSCLESVSYSKNYLDKVVHVSKVISENLKTTKYSFRVERGQIMPQDGIGRTHTDLLTIERTKIQRRSGATAHYKCSLKKEKVLLLHGAHLKGSSWSLVQKELKEMGVPSEAIDLPGRGAQSTEGTSLEDNAKAVCHKLSSMGPSKVVAHSQAGAIANHAFGLCPSKFNSIYYVAAVLPLPGEKAFDQLEDRDLKWYDKSIKYDSDNHIFKIFDRNLFVSAFAQDLLDQTLIAKLKREAVNESGALGDTKISFDLEAWKELERYYIETTKDRIITPETQRKYIARSYSPVVLRITSSHSPMLSKPAELARIIR